MTMMDGDGVTYEQRSIVYCSQLYNNGEYQLVSDINTKLQLANGQLEYLYIDRPAKELNDSQQRAIAYYSIKGWYAV